MAVYLIYSILCSFFLSSIPFFSFPITVLLYALYFALFIFLLKWDYSKETLAYFDNNLAYFIGFGLIFSACTNLFEGALNDGVYWLLFPVFILSSANSQPPIIGNVSSFGEFKKYIFNKEM